MSKIENVMCSAVPICESVTLGILPVASILGDSCRKEQATERPSPENGESNIERKESLIHPILAFEAGDAVICRCDSTGTYVRILTVSVVQPGKV